MSALTQRASDMGAVARERAPWADVGFLAFQRELGLGGGLLAGGLAYRLFLWLLPVGLLGAQILGFWASANEDSVEDAAKEFGIGAAAVACRARNSPNRTVAPPMRPRTGAEVQAYCLPPHSLMSRRATAKAAASPAPR